MKKIITITIGIAALFALSMVSPPEHEAGAQSIPFSDFCESDTALQTTTKSIVCYVDIEAVEDVASLSTPGQRQISVTGTDYATGTPRRLFPVGNYDPTNPAQLRAAQSCWSSLRKAQTNKRVWAYVIGSEGCGNVMAP